MGLLLLWQGTAWWSLQTLAMPWALWVALGSGMLFGGAILGLWSIHYRRLKRAADYRVLAAVKTVLGQVLLSPNSLQLEVTEGLLVNASERVVRELNVLKDAGVQLALDDFGTGYSSLSYLRHLPFTVLKIDKTFINEVARRRQDEAMVGAMVKMGHSLGMVVVAEGVETAAQMHCLEALEVDCIQGYYFSQALSPRELENRFLSKGRATGVALDASVWDRL